MVNSCNLFPYKVPNETAHGNLHHLKPPGNRGNDIVYEQE